MTAPTWAKPGDSRAEAQWGHWQKGEVRSGFPGERVSVTRGSGVFWQRTGEEGNIPDGKNMSKDPNTCGVICAEGSKQAVTTRTVVLSQGDFATPFRIPTRDICQCLGTFLVVTPGGKGCSSRQNPTLLLNILQCTEQPPTPKNYLVPNASSVEKACIRGWHVNGAVVAYVGNQ